METRSDGDLLAAWHAGEIGAFEDLVSRYQARLLQHARSLMGEGREYEDVVQEAFLRLAQRPPVLADVGDPRVEHLQLSSWLHKVTRNCCMDALRSNKRRKRREEDTARGEATSGGLATVEERDTRAAVEISLQRLPIDQREVLALRLFGDHSYKEIAEVTGKKIGTVGWLISTGLKALAGDLESFLAPQHTGDVSPADGAGRMHGGL